MKLKDLMVITKSGFRVINEKGETILDNDYRNIDFNLIFRYADYEVIELSRNDNLIVFKIKVEE